MPRTNVLKRRSRMKTSGVRFLFSALLTGALISMPAGSLAQISIGININIEPPALPVYVQPPCPQPNYMWTPGYWAWDGVGDYYWVPGTWVLAPQPGYLWTPDYWGWGRWRCVCLQCRLLGDTGRLLRRRE